MRKEPSTPPQSVSSDPAADSPGDETSSFSPETIDDTAASSDEADSFDAAVEAPTDTTPQTSDPETDEDTSSSANEQLPSTADTSMLLEQSALPLYSADVGIMPLAVDSTIGSARSVSFVTNSFGGTTSGAYRNQFDYMGRYRFNICGNTVVRGKADAQWGYILHDDYSAESRADFFEKTDTVSYDYPSGTCTTNSSSSSLNNRGGSPTIKQAFLVITYTCRLDGRENNIQTNPMSKYGVSLKGPKGGLSRFFANRLYLSTQTIGTTQQVGGRQSCFIDVTSFVQQQGYGVYTGVNIPFSNRSKYSDSTPGASDLVGSWKLIVIEEVPSLPIRKLQLKFGGAPVNANSALTASIGGNGLFVANNPTGETLVSLDASDPDEGSQMLSYTTSENSSPTNLYCGSIRAANNFFTFKVDINGSQVWQRPAARTSSKPLSGTSSYFDTSNTDLSLMSINGGWGTMTLKGKETNVTLKVSVTERDVILSALGIAADVVTPTFKTTLHVSNLTKNWATSDPGYLGTRDFATPGDRLRATMISTNTSDQQNLGLANGTIVVKLPAFKTIDRSSVIARFKDQYGTVRTFSNISISGNTLTVSTGDGFQVRKGSYFEVVCEGEAADTNSFTTYSNSCSLSGALVDTTGTTQTSSYIDNLGQATRNSTADGTKYDLLVSSSGPGSIGITNTAAALPASGPYTTSTSLYGTATGYAAWRPNAGAHVAFIMVDGQVRCDLEGADRVSVPMAGASHQVHVAFAEGDAPEKGDAPYTVTTEGDAGLTDLTPTTGNLAAGASHEVTWDVAPGYALAEIKVDGVPVPIRGTDKVSFDKLAGNHSVTVRTTASPADRLAVRTAIIGPGTITPASTVTPGQNYPVSWSGTVSEAILNYVKVNGVTVFDKNKDTPTQTQPRPSSTAELPKDVAALFSNIQEDVSIEVCYIDPNRTTTTPSPYTVRTQLMGGAGSATPTLTVTPGGTAKLSWKPADGWEVGGVTVIRGDSRTEYAPGDTELTAGDLGIELSNVQSDCLVQVTLKRGQIDIVTEAPGGGQITPSLLDVKPGSDQTVTWSAPPGKHIVSVIVDGVVRDDLIDAGKITFENVDAGHTVTVVVADDGDPTDPDGPDGPLPPDPDGPDDPRTPEDGDLFRVTVTCSGAGSAGPSALVKAGGSHTVTWTGENGVAPVAVYVDGCLRPSLTAAGSIAFTGLAAHHRVHVVFPANPDDPDNPPDPDNPDADRFTVTTHLTGGAGTIAGSASYAPGANAHVPWTVGDGWRVKAVTVDGQWRPELTGATQVNFPAIDANHEVVVELEEDLWRVDVTYSGCGTAGQSATVRAGASHQVTWSPQAGLSVLRVLVDGAERADLLTAGAADFTNIRGNHTVHVEFQQDPPDDAQWKRVDINLVGGPGEASGSGRVPVGDNHAVQWKPAAGWQVANVIVDDRERPDLLGAGTLEFTNVQEDHSVVVRLAPAPLGNGLSVTTRLTGGAAGATITPSEDNLAPGANRTVSWTVPAGWRVQSVTVDGIARDDLLLAGSVPFPAMTTSHTVEVALTQEPRQDKGLYRIDVTCDGAGVANGTALVTAGANHLVTWHGINGARPVRITVDGVERPDLLDAGALPFASVFADHTVHVEFDAPEDATLCEVRTSITGGAGSITGSCRVPAGTDAVVEWTVTPGYRVKAVTVDGVAQDTSLARWGFSAVAGDHEVAVELEMDLWRVDVTWEGQGSAGPSALVVPGADHRVEWAPDAGRTVLSVTVDGEDRPDLVGASFLDLAGIDRDHQVHIVFDRDPSVEAWHHVNVRLEGGPGTSSGSGEVPEGADRAVTWKPAAGYRVKAVTVDGEERPDLMSADTTSFADIHGDHEVLVELEPDFATPPEPSEPTPPDTGDPDDPNNGSGNNGDGGSGDGNGSHGPDSPGTGASEAGDPHGGSGNRGSGFATALMHLAQTGDPVALLALGAAALGFGSGAFLLAGRRRRR